MSMDGFSSYEGNATSWRVFHDKGSTIVHATSEAIALQRFMAKYPNCIVRKIVRLQFDFKFVVSIGFVIKRLIIMSRFLLYIINTTVASFSFTIV